MRSLSNLTDTCKRDLLPLHIEAQTLELSIGLKYHILSISSDATRGIRFRKVEDPWSGYHAHLFFQGRISQTNEVRQN
jgi:hypothetical protein